MSFNKTFEEKKLLQLLAEDSQYAFTQLFDNYRQQVYGVAYHILKSHLAAEEIVQDVFMKIWIKRTEMTDIGNFSAFLYTIARNLTFDRLKHLAYDATAKKELSLRDHSVNDTDHRVRHNQYEKLVQEAVNRLPDQQRKVYLLSKQSGLSHDEIARELHISRLTAKKHLVIAMRSIRKYILKHLTVWIGFLIQITLLIK